MIKKYLERKSKIGIAIDVVILILLILLIIPKTRKDTFALLLKPTLIIHQPKVQNKKTKLQENDYLWNLKDLKGNNVEFSEFRNKVVFINLWATWCPPCIAEMDGLQKLYDEYNQKVDFLFVTNENTDEVKQFLNDKEFNIPVYFPQTAYPKSLDSNSLPTTFIISKNGEIVVKKNGVARWNSKRVRKILNSLVN